MKKRILAGLLSLCLLLALLPATVWAGGDETYAGLTVGGQTLQFSETASGEGWSYDGNYTLTLTDYSGSGIVFTPYDIDHSWLNLVINGSNTFPGIALNSLYITYTGPEHGRLNLSGNGTIDLNNGSFLGSSQTEKIVCIKSGSEISMTNGNGSVMGENGQITVESGAVLNITENASGGSLGANRFYINGGTVNSTNIQQVTLYETSEDKGFSISDGGTLKLVRTEGNGGGAVLLKESLLTGLTATDGNGNPGYFCGENSVGYGYIGPSSESGYADAYFTVIIRAAGSCAHQWSDWETTREASCTDAGEQTRICGVCQDTQTQSIPALGHQLTYTQSSTGITQSCARESCGHTASAALSAVNGVYTGAAVENASVTCDDGWIGSVPSITYADHVNAGTATATVAIGDVSASVEFQIAKASSHTLTLGNLSQTSGSVSAVTWTVAPADSTAQVRVEYQVPVSAVSCGHVHDESCGENGENCTHQHDEACGYREAGTEWTAALPTEAGSYPVRARLTESSNLELAAADAYTTGTLTVRTSSSGGGDSSGNSGSSGSSGNTTTETTTNSDGSKTTTVTDKKTGAVTETTRYTDGSTLVVETTTDGAVTTTETAANGVKVKTVDEPGEDVTATVTIPRSVDEVTVTIPAEVDYGMVAVNAETGEIIKRSVPTGDGMLVKLDGSAELVLVDNAKDFTDTNNHWAENAIDFISAHGMMNGTGETTFSPGSQLTRGMLAVVLYNFEGNPENSFAGTFSDVASDAWYADGVNWAAGLGVVSGYGNGRFGAENSITREQMATIFYNYAKTKGYDVTADTDLSGYTDAGSVNSYAADAMRWAVHAGLIEGTTGSTLSAQDNATRAQVATIFMRFVECIVK